MTTSTSSPEQKIQTAVEQVMREHLAACEAAAAAVVREGSRRAAQPARRRAPATRRSREQLAELERRLYEAVCAQPGERMGCSPKPWARRPGS